MVVVPKGTIERVLLTMHSQGTAAARHHRERNRARRRAQTERKHARSFPPRLDRRLDRGEVNGEVRPARSLAAHITGQDGGHAGVRACGRGREGRSRPPSIG